MIVDCYTDAALTVPEQYEWAWGNAPADAQTICDIKDAGFDAVRLPVTWGQHCDSDMNIDSAWLARVREVVDEILANDMYCVLNVHHDTNLGWLNADMSEVDYQRFEKLWKSIANAFADYDEMLLFEGYNEINGKDSSGETIWGFYEGRTAENQKDYDRCIAAANRLNQLFVDTVRASGGRNVERVLVCMCSMPASSVTAGITRHITIRN